MSFASDISSWLESAEQRLSAFSVIDRDCGLIPLTFRVSDPQVLKWVERALTPLLDGRCPSIENHAESALHFDYLYDDDLAAQLTDLFTKHDERRVYDDLNSRGEYRCQYSNDQTVLLLPSEGVAIHLDLRHRRFLFIHSSRTRWPAIQFGEMVYEPLLRIALDHGGVPFHAGAVGTDRGAILVVGYSGDGKTSLITGLMHAGAAFIGHERTFVKQDGLRFNAFSFPDWVNLGLGTAMNDPRLSELLPVPDAISVPQGRFKWGRPQRYDRSEWPHLDDRISLLPDELSQKLQAPAPTSGLPIVGIVRPKVTRRPIDARITPVEGDQLTDLLGHNISELTSYPDWMDWNPSEAEPDIDALAQLPAIRLRFYLDDGHVQGMTNVLDEIHEALDIERRRKRVSAAAHTEQSPI